MPAQVDTRLKRERVGMIFNISATGALLATASAFRIGARAMLTLSLPDESRQVQSRIVRLEANEQGTWPYTMAVQFHRELDASVLAAMSPAL